jgi:hypothetical protein
MINSSSATFELEIPFSIDSLKADINFDFLVKTTTSQVSAEEATSLLIYPNPGNGVFTLKSTHRLIQEGAVLLNVIGQEVQFDFQLSSEGYTGKLALESLSSGVYYLKVKSDGGSYLGARFIAN